MTENTSDTPSFTGRIAGKGSNAFTFFSGLLYGESSAATRFAAQLIGESAQIYQHFPLERLKEQQNTSLYKVKEEIETMKSLTHEFDQSELLSTTAKRMRNDLTQVTSAFARSSHPDHNKMYAALISTADMSIQLSQASQKDSGKKPAVISELCDRVDNFAKTLAILISVEELMVKKMIRNPGPGGPSGSSPTPPFMRITR